jgi:lactoylglutathione lyase
LRGSIIDGSKESVGRRRVVFAEKFARFRRMRIDHIALWTTDLERCKQFYASYFGAVAAANYVNPVKGFTSCFLSFSEGARIEVMTTTTLAPVAMEAGAQRMGLTHIAVSVGSAEGVAELTRKLSDDGFAIIDGPRRTGDGYYESVVLDPDGNRIEITT